MEEHKKHRTKKAGPKAERKKEKTRGDDQTARQRNPKAFSIQSAVKAAKKFHRSQDVKTKKIHIPLPDRTVLEPPPVVVGIVGPPKVGKTTLLQCLVKNYTRQKITNIQGPVTVVSGKQRRLTFMECSNDINHMIDIAKVADLVILMVDASFGFEMEIFEFLNILQVHGFPKVMGVLNHLDTFNDNKKTRKTKKRLKDRFWTEIYQGAKLFYLSGMIDGEYQKTEIHNLCRFISVMKFRPLTWRTTHPYILADRMEDITPPEEIEKNPKCDRRVTLYGYNRGVALKNQQAVHIPGMGDFRIADVEQLTDPCPTPEMEKRRTLNQKERLIYAPMSGVGGILYDKDAVYINVGGSHYYDQEESEEMTPVKELLSSLLGPAKASDESEEGESSDGEDSMPTEQLFTSDGRVRRKAIFTDEKDTGAGSGDEDSEDGQSDEEEEEDDSDDEEEEEEERGDKDTDESMQEGSDLQEEDASEEEMDQEEEGNSGIDTDDSDDIEGDCQLETEKAVLEMKKRREGKGDYHRMIYGESDGEEEEGREEGEEEEDMGDLFRVLRKEGESREEQYAADLTDCSRFPVATAHDWDLEEVRELIADCFVTGRWDKDEDCAARLEADDELYGDFEDLETGEKHTADMDKNESDGENDGEKEEEKVEGDKLEEKKKQKQEFDLAYDHNKHRITDDDEFLQNWKRELEEQTKLNRAEFENMSAEMRRKIEGYRPGLYLRVEVAGVPCEFVHHFRPIAPLVLGGLSNVEENVGYVQTRFKKHRFYKNQLKTKNPVTMSLGWRRFQTLPIFSKAEDNMRQRMLKYTPPHIHCVASFWGPITPQGSGVLAVDAGDITHKFRISGTGVVLELDKSLEITKKLKLTGTPVKIMQKTAYIEGMFNTPLEVAKFEGATIKTVSGIRGTIKKHANRLAKTGQTLTSGTFRATFEDRILLSDIVFLTTWYPVEVPQFYNPSTSLLGTWQSMKPVGQLRHERSIPVPLKEDSLYRPVERRRHRSVPLRIPKSLCLPFKLTPKPVAVEKTPVILEPSESKKAKFLHQLKVVHEFNMRTKHAIMRQRAHKHSLQMEKRAAEKDQKLKTSRQEVYRQLGKMERAKAARERGRSKQSS
ncbi:ribosome biogenesis protein BMS1 homolog isoform X3 [Babylonia areolata]|uniref:ribosome biogenesis protein BMS1 homolog isoform X3 n=1 Tax=Babylonia areolata TaxID=304850 RepID=UPI003FD12B90